jgi:hypothetical protein
MTFTNISTRETFKGVASINGPQVVAFKGHERERTGRLVITLLPETIKRHGIRHGMDVEVTLSDDRSRIQEVISPSALGLQDGQK